MLRGQKEKQEKKKDERKTKRLITDKYPKSKFFKNHS